MSSANNNNGHNGHLNVQEDDVPPPPYTETDIYSNSGAGGSRSPHTMTSSQTLADDGTSSAGDIIYTPPLSPHISPAPQQSGAALYFESRPLSTDQRGSMPRETLVYTVNVNDTSLPENLPYQSVWAARDVTAQDWATFVNYLLPDHTTRGNEAVLSRKLQAEGKSDSASVSSGASQVEAQLGQVRDAAPSGSPNAAQRRRDIEATVQQWNDGFFGPRGINVRLEPPSDQQPPMPGAWGSNFDQRDSAPAQGEVNRLGQGRIPGPGWRGWGDFHVDENGIRYGDKFVADQNGLRIGNLVMDQHGIRLQGDRPGERHVLGQGGAGPSVGQPMPASAPPYDYGPGDNQEREIRGRRIHHYEGGMENNRRGRSRSVSSVSSASSSSSESSIGSLPDYDDIHQQAMPLYISRLQDWTTHPDQMRTKSDVKQLKSELKSVSKSRDVALDTDKKVLKAQIKALTGEWKQIKRQQKRDRRERKRERRERKRAEKKERRQNKREMKKAQKEARRRSYPGPLPAPGAPPPPCIPPLPPMPAGQSNPSQPPQPPNASVPYWGSFPFGRGGRGCPGPSPRGGGFFGSSAGGFSCRHPPFCGGNHAGDHGPFGPNGPFGESGPFGSNGPFGAKGPFGPGGPFGVGGPFSAGGGSNSRSVPGSWPDEKKGAALFEAQDGMPPPGPVAAAKYRAMENIQAAIEQQVAAAERVGPGPQKAGLEKAIKKLTENLEKLRMEADEAYAKDVMHSEARGDYK